MNTAMTDNVGIPRGMRQPIHEDRNAMAYVLETITPEDQQKIIRDAACDPMFQQLLAFALQSPHGGFPKRWVIDHERDFYMFIPPSKFARPETSESPKSFFFKGRFYAMNIVNQFSNELELVDNPPPSQLQEFQEEITFAFAVSGRGSGGPLNEFGEPEFAFVPVFKFGKGK